MRTITLADLNERYRSFLLSQMVVFPTVPIQVVLNKKHRSNRRLSLRSGTCDEGQFKLVITRLRIHGAFDLLSSFVCIERDLACH